jgi:apolipoprotein N-acyltransferase
LNGEPEQELVSVAAGARGDAGALVRRVAALWRHGLALGAGALLACAFAPQGWWPLAFISPAVLILLWERATPRRAAWLGFWFGFGLFAAGTYWLYGSLNLMAPVWLALGIALALMGLMALYHALTGYAVVRFFPSGPVRWLLAAPAIWLLLEWLRGWLFSGFPWLSIGYTQTGTELAHLAPIAGVYGISLVVLLAAGALVALVRGTRRVRIAAAAVLLVPWAAAMALGRVAWTHPAGPPVPVAIVQANISERTKLLGDHTERILMRYQRMTESAFGERLIVWPESALPDLINNLFPYVEHLDIAARRHGSALVMGVLRESDTGHYYNSILALGKRASWYSKRHLVPFAEYFPVPRFVRRWLKEMNLPYSSFTPGPAHQRPLPVAGLELGPSVCYEVAYGDYMLRMLPKADALVNVTDDAWFGSSSARYQQFQMARMRSQEEGRYMIVSTDNGVSGVIGPEGQVVAEAPVMVRYVLRSSVTPMKGMTPFARVGNGLAVILAALAAAAAFALRLVGLRRTMSRR